MLLNIGLTTTTYFKFDWATSILVTDVGDESVGDNLEMLMTVLAVFVTSTLSFNISAELQYSKDVTNINILSPTPKKGHQH